MRIIQVLVLGLIGTALPVQFAIADADGERAALARIIHELQAIDPLITEAASQANPDIEYLIIALLVRGELPGRRLANSLSGRSSNSSRAMERHHPGHETIGETERFFLLRW